VEAVAAAKQLTTETGTSWYVVKAQVHAGGRGKGGGVKLAKTYNKLKISEQIIGTYLHRKHLRKVKKVRKVFAEDVYYPGESVQNFMFLFY
jgi:succinyl-CoA synthetase beta subunit